MISRTLPTVNLEYSRTFLKRFSFRKNVDLFSCLMICKFSFFYGPINSFGPTYTQTWNVELTSDLSQKCLHFDAMHKLFNFDQKTDSEIFSRTQAGSVACSDTKTDFFFK
jgi:hypothetical protein